MLHRVWSGVPIGRERAAGAVEHAVGVGQTHHGTVRPPRSTCTITPAAGETVAKVAVAGQDMRCISHLINGVRWRAGARVLVAHGAPDVPNLDCAVALPRIRHLATDALVENLDCVRHLINSAKVVHEYRCHDYIECRVRRQLRCYM